MNTRLIPKNTFVERRGSSVTRSLLRLGIVLAGLILWSYLNGLISGVFSFMENYILNHAVSGFISLAILFPLWKLIPVISGKYGRNDGRMAAASAFVLIAPFIAIAFSNGLEYRGVTSEWFAFAAALFFLAATEEVLCRGFMMDALSFRRNRFTGLLLSSLIFAMLHLGNNYASITGIVNIFLAGVLFGFVRLVTGGLFYPIVIHWFWNLTTGMVFGWNVSGHAFLPAIFKPVTHPPWGSFGPEESILMTIGTLGAIAILVKKLYIEHAE